MLIGYARVSTHDQMLDLQRDAMKEAGCEQIFEDAAGGVAERPNLEQALSHLRAGDTPVVWRLDRLGRSLKDLIAWAEELRSRGVGLKSLKEAIDTDSPTGQLTFHIFGALAEFERALIRERTHAGLQAARARGRLGGRRKRLNPRQRAHAMELYEARQHTVKEICRLMGFLGRRWTRTSTNSRRSHNAIEASVAHSQMMKTHAAGGRGSPLPQLPRLSFRSAFTGSSWKSMAT